MALDGLSDAERVELERLLKELDAKVESNPLYRFRRDNQPQIDFMAADTRIQAAFCGNRFGKTTALIVKALIQVLPPEYVPEWMLPFKKWFAGVNTVYPGVKGRLLCPTFQVLETVVVPELRRWVPEAALKNGRWQGAWNKQIGLLQFANGSFLEFRTYQQDVSHMAGASLHFVGYDEPPPWEHRRECRVRLTDYDGFEMFAMTPLKVNTGWVRRTIYKNREHPDVTVIRGGMRDNKLLSSEAIEATLEAQPDAWRAAVEFGDFVDIGGLVYPDFERCVVKHPYELVARKGGSGGRQNTSGGWSKWYTDQTKNMKVNANAWDIVVGIDPGIRNFAAVFCGFDDENRMFVFDELLLQNAHAGQAAEQIKKKVSSWGVKEALYVIDPAARQRAQVNSDTVQSELMRQGIPTVNGQNDVEAGVNQIKMRLANGMLFANPDCRGLRDEADDYALEDREDGVFKPVKVNDHRLDALRYVAMARAWAPQEDVTARRELGFVEGEYDAAREDLFLNSFVESGPMGAWG